MVVASPRKMAWVCPVGVCKWCGDTAVTIGAYVDIGESTSVVVSCCEKHSGHLTSMIDGLVDGQLSEAFKQQMPAKEQLN